MTDQDRILAYTQKDPLATYRKIGLKLGLPSGNVHYHIKNLIKEGRLMRTEMKKPVWKTL